MRPEIWLLVVGVFISSISQLILKVGADRPISSQATRWGNLRSQYLNRFVISGYALLAISMVLSIVALMTAELKYAAVIEALGYGFVMVLSWIFLHEHLSWRKIIGNIIIVAGVAIFSISIF